MPRVSLLLSLALLLSLPAVALLPGQEFLVSTPAIEPAPFSRHSPRVASNGEGFLVVWTDGLPAPQGWELRAARLNEIGEVIDTTGLRIADSVATENLSVASDGGDYIVAYECELQTTCLAKVDAETGVVGARSSIRNAHRPALASNGRSYMLSYWRGGANAVDVVRIDPGDLLASGPLVSVIGGSAPSLASNGTDYLLVWGSHAMEIALISEDGAFRRRDLISFPPSRSGPPVISRDVASDGRDFLLVWQRNLGYVDRAFTSDLRSTFISRDGSVGTTRIVSTEPERAWFPAMAWTGSSYVVTYSALAERHPAAVFYSPPAEGDLYRLTLGAGGDIVAPPSLLRGVRGFEGLSDVASGDRGTVAVWRRIIADRGGDAAEIEAYFLDRNARMTVSRTQSWQEAVTGAVAGDGAVIAWQEIVGDTQQRKVYLQQLDGTGSPRHGRGVAVSSSTWDQVHPAVGGTMVAWIDRAGSVTSSAYVSARRLDEQGRPVQAVISMGESSYDSRLSIAEAERQHLIVWESPEQNIVAARVAADGRVLDRPALLISGDDDEAWGPVVTTDGTNYLVVWNRRENYPVVCLTGCPSVASVQAALVTQNGAVIRLAEIDSLRVTPSYPFAVWNGSEFAVFRSGYDPVSSRGPVSAIRIDRFGHRRPAVTVREAGGFVTGAAWSAHGYDVSVSGSRVDLIRLDDALQPVDEVTVAHALMNFPWRWPRPRSAPLAPWTVAVIPHRDLTLVAYRQDNGEGISRAMARYVAAGPNAEESLPSRRRSAGRR